MPSFADSAIIFVLALLLFGPKKLPELARYVGKLMGEFRRASSEFRLQMEDEFRVIEQAEQQKKIAALQAATPVAALAQSTDTTPETIPETIPPTSDEIAANLAAHTTPPVTELNLRPDPSETISPPDRYRTDTPETPAPTPTAIAIAQNGDLQMLPPATGLPVSRTPAAPTPTLSGVFESIPRANDPEPEVPQHG